MLLTQMKREELPLFFGLGEAEVFVCTDLRQQLIDEQKSGE
jgi:hypothetical protein